MYGLNLTIPIELVAQLATKEESTSGVEKAKEIQKLHDKTYEHLQKI